MTPSNASDADPGDGPDVERARRRAASRLLVETLAPYRRRLVLVVACTIISTSSALGVPYLVKYGIDSGVIPGQPSVLLRAVVAMVALAVAGAAGQWCAQRLAGQVAESSLLDLRLRLWRHVQSLPLGFYEGQQSGRVIARVTNDVEAVNEVFSSAALTVVPNALLVIGTAVFLFLLDPVLALTVMAVMPALVVATRFFRVRSARAYRGVREKVAVLVVQLSETLTGMRAVQAFVREPLSRAAFDEVNDEHRRVKADAVRLGSGYGPFIQFLGHVSLFLVLVVGGLRAADGAMTVGVLTAFILYLRQFYDPFQDLSQFQDSLRAASAGLENIADILATTSALPEGPDACALELDGGRIGLAGVTFAYGDIPVLHEVDLAVRAGETLGLVGETGAGKSTIAKLMARFYDPNSGSVSVDGQDLREVSLGSLRRAVVIVGQEGFLFRGTIHDNIALGRPGAPRDEIEGAARAVGAHPFVSALPEGYDTDVKRRGALLSSGQRQLVALARAWLADPRILILDEATSSLDVPSERLVQLALRRLLEGRSAVIIAHRLSAMELADRVGVVEGGRIVELGTTAELLANETRFRSLHEGWERSRMAGWAAE